MKENDIGKIVIDTAISVHRELGPGLLESVYEIILSDELIRQNLSVKRQVPIPLCYKNKKFTEAFKADIVVNDKVLIELKSVEQLSKAHRKQLQTYLRLSKIKLGYLLNFGNVLMKQGIVRAVNNLEET